MIRFLFRFLGLLTLAAAFILVVYDGARFIANQTLDLTTVGYVWASVHQNSLLLFQPAVERHVAPWVWQSLIQPYLLEQPASLLLLIFGMIFVLLGRRKKPLIGYAR
ncbi:MAG: hypothetical protein GEU91_11520 [Rhizobiales bacterium]|nr:hypothetical protein [Hyphomicrobiales bacterium]